MKNSFTVSSLFHRIIREKDEPFFRKKNLFTYFPGGEDGEAVEDSGLRQVLIAFSLPWRHQRSSKKRFPGAFTRDSPESSVIYLKPKLDCPFESLSPDRCSYLIRAKGRTEC
jgi:hypothetical protein